MLLNPENSSILFLYALFAFFINLARFLIRASCLFSKKTLIPQNSFTKTLPTAIPV